MRYPFFSFENLELSVEGTGNSTGFLRHAPGSSPSRQPDIVQSCNLSSFRKEMNLYWASIIWQNLYAWYISMIPHSKPDVDLARLTKNKAQGSILFLNSTSILLQRSLSHISFGRKKWLLLLLIRGNWGCEKLWFVQVHRARTWRITSVLYTQPFPDNISSFTNCLSLSIYSYFLFKNHSPGNDHEPGAGRKWKIGWLLPSELTV